MHLDAKFHVRTVELHQLTHNLVHDDAHVVVDTSAVQLSAHGEGKWQSQLFAAGTPTASVAVTRCTATELAGFTTIALAAIASKATARLRSGRATATKGLPLTVTGEARACG